MKRTRFPVSPMYFILALVSLSTAFPVGAELKDPFLSWNQTFEPYQVIANIYYVGTNEMASFLITTSQKLPEN